MESTDKETQDFMKVESFSQLPFIRPPPPKEKSIRLFGQEFSGGNSSTASSSSPPPQANVHRESKDNEPEEETSRKFECHYCCRNFPTSQALGGHQNAHKRERQLAKRAHLHSAAMAHAGISDFYGLPNYHRLSSALPPPAATAYHYGYNNRLFSSHGSYGSQPAYNGNIPSAALWRIPSTRDRNLQYFERTQPPLLENDELKPMRLTGSISQSRLVFEPKPSVQDHVSLDLHL